MRQSIPDRDIVLYPNRAKLFRQNLPVLYSGLLMFPIIMAWRSGKRALQIISLAGGILLFLWETLYASFLYRLLIPKPVVVVNDEGITYDPPAPWFVVFSLSICWEEMAAIFLSDLTIRSKKETKTTRFLCIMPKDQEAYIKQQKILRPRRFAQLVMMSIIKVPFLLPEHLVLPISLDQLFTHIRLRYAPEIAAYNIEIRENQKITVPDEGTSRDHA